MNPTVTVVLDTYNHERFVEEAIRSVLAQDFPRDETEILVVDDGSTDRTPEIVRRFEPQVRLLTKSNGGQASAINFGLAYATGEFVAFLDGDDLWMPQKISRIVAEFRKDPRTALVWHRFSFWDCRDNSRWDAPFISLSGNILCDPDKLMRFQPGPTSALAFRRSLVNVVLPIPEQCSFMHDVYLISTVLCFGTVAAIDENLMTYRVHGQNLCFAEKGDADYVVLRRRAKTWKVAADAIERWTRSKAPKSSRAAMYALADRHRQAAICDELRAGPPPDRLGHFLFGFRYNKSKRAAMTSPQFAYTWAYMLMELIVGREHAHYLEGVRTRVKRIRHYFEHLLRPARQ